MLKSFSAILSVVLAAVLVWYGWRGSDSDTPTSTRSRSEATTVTLASAQRASEVTRIEAVGTAEALHSVTLFPASAGEVEAVSFASGDQVEAGQTLLRLDARDQQLALELAQALLADAQRTLNRYLNAGSEAAFTPNQLDAARIAVEQARIARDRAAVALDDRSVEAPFAGVIGLSDIDPGDRIDTTTAIATLDDRSSLYVRFSVPEAFLGQLLPGDQVQLQPWNDRLPETSAVIADVDSRVNQTSRTLMVRALLQNEQDQWRPGMGFRVLLDLQGPDYVRLPELAMQWGGDGAYIWVIDEQSRARQVAVTLIQRRDGEVLVDGDIDQGQMVVMEGVQKMSDGRLVEVVDSSSLDQDVAVQAHRSSGQ
ncbi:MAG: efflux RND transporter periplasmic adaptor subunit [Wenzhouxiangellaceae bacterium]